MKLFGEFEVNAACWKCNAVWAGDTTLRLEYLVRVSAGMKENVLCSYQCAYQACGESEARILHSGSQLNFAKRFFVHAFS